MIHKLSENVPQICHLMSICRTNKPQRWKIFRSISVAVLFTWWKMLACPVVPRWISRALCIATPASFRSCLMACQVRNSQNSDHCKTLKQKFTMIHPANSPWFTIFILIKWKNPWKIHGLRPVVANRGWSHPAPGLPRPGPRCQFPSPSRVRHRRHRRHGPCGPPLSCRP